MFSEYVILCDSVLCLRVTLNIVYYFKVCFFAYEALLNFSQSVLYKSITKNTTKTF